MSEIQRMKLPEKRISLADMARAAAKRNSLPPPQTSDDSSAFGAGIPRAPTSSPQSSLSALPVNRPSAIGAANPDGHAAGDDSGFIDLRMLRPMLTGQPAAAASPALTPPPPAAAVQRPPATLGLDTLKPASVSVLPPPPSGSVADSGVRAAAAAQALSNKFDGLDDAPFGRRRRRITPAHWAGGLLAVAGIAGAYFWGMRSQPPAAVAMHSVANAPQAAAVIDTPTPPVQAADPAVAKADPVPAQAAPPEPVAAAPAQPQQPPQSTLAHAAGAGARVAAAPAREVPSKAGKATRETKAAPEPKPAPEPKAAPEPKQAAPAPESKPAPGGDPLAGAIRNAVGPIDKPKPEAVVQQTGPVSANSDLPEQPGKGAISGALSGPRGVAKTCLEGHNAPASVSVVFGSDGKVQNVNVTGAGPASDCVKKAFLRANVGAFRRSTFPVSVTVTPP